MRGYLIEHDIPLSQLGSRLQSDVPAPSLKPEGMEVLVDVYSASLNYFDILQVQGKYQVKKPFPYVPGTEIAGVISANSPIPEGCSFVPGKTRVFGAADGSYATQTKADYWQLFEVPDGMSFEEASGIFITWPTSYAALKFRANVQPDEWVLVHAGAGGVGLCAIQIAKAFGARVIATAGSDDKLKVCKQVGGADEVVNYRDAKWIEQVKTITGGNGVDVVYDPVGMVVPSLKCIAWNGRIVVVGFAAGNIEKIPANLVLLKNCAVMGVFWGAYSKNEVERIPETWQALFDLYESGRLKPTVFSRIYEGLEMLPAALQDLQDRKTWGKTVVRIRADSLQPAKRTANL